MSFLDIKVIVMPRIVNYIILDNLSLRLQGEVNYHPIMRRIIQQPSNSVAREFSPWCSIALCIAQNNKAYFSM